MMTGRKRLPTLDEQEHRGTSTPAPAPDSIDYWLDADRWQELGRRVQADATEERKTGTPPAGASARLAAFRSLRKRLDRRAR